LILKGILIYVAGLLFMTSPVLLSQTRVVYGKLKTFNTFPLQNVEVTAKKTGAAVKSDSLGRFSIVCARKDVIRIKPKAFKPVSRKIGDETDTLEINLIFIDSEANRQVATGYGYIDQRDLNYAVSHLEQENNEFCNYLNIFDLIRGRFPGVAVSNGAVVIRGVNSINLSSEALYVVDGVIMSDISWVRPCEVRSIDVLKDGISAMYGSRGANGVVVIETRR